MSRPIAVDLFAGAGGMSLGFEQAGFDVLAAVEVDPVHCAVHEYNFPHCSMICKSIIDTTGAEIRNRSAIGAKDIDVVFGGPPCQGVSLMGRRALDDPRNALMSHFVRLVLELNPRYFVMENVKGLTIGNHRQILTEIILTLRENGFKVIDDYQVLNAAHFGVPQDRRRLFLMGCRAGEEMPVYPAATSRPATPEARGGLDIGDRPYGPCVWDAIGDLPEANDFPQLLDGDSVRATFGVPSAYATLLRTSANRGDYSHPRPLNETMLTSSMRTKHTAVSMSRFAATAPGEMEPISRFPRLHPKGICNTLRAGTGSERGAYTSPRPIHPYSLRCITVREAARLHSYPDWFRFHVTKWHGFRQIGNSVPPFLARAVAERIMHASGQRPERSTEMMFPEHSKLLQFDMTEASDYYRIDRNLLGRRIRVQRADHDTVAGQRDSRIITGQHCTGTLPLMEVADA